MDIGPILPTHFLRAPSAHSNGNLLWSLTLSFPIFQCQVRDSHLCVEWQKPAAQAEGETFTFWRHNLISDIALTTVRPLGPHSLP